ncbi:MAG TPA: response regulator [Peptococcaceae bacterium]|nr:response regulator [Peptococcaceae bacterium]
MIKAILIDDEEMALEELKYALKGFAQIRVQQAYSDPLSALKELAAYQPDVVFLDIEMPEINGFVVAEEILTKKPDTYIVFVTAYDEYAIKAFEANALDYILKPVAKKRLSQTIDKIEKRFAQDNNNFSELSRYLKSSQNKILVWENEEIILLKPSDILYFKAQDGNVLAVTEKRSIRPGIP